jgi:hypothetical protein
MREELQIASNPRGWGEVEGGPEVEEWTMQNTMKLVLAGLVASALLAVAMGGEDAKADKAPSVNERLAATVRIEVRTERGEPGPTYVLKDRAKIKALTGELAKHPRYRGEPAGWDHEVRIEFHPAQGEPLVAYTHGAEVLGHSDSFLSYQGDGERLLSKACVRLLEPLVQQAEAMPAAKPKLDLSGTWEGQVLFTNGLRARVSLDLNPGGKGLVGSYTLREQDEHGLGKPQRVPVTASLKDDMLSLSLPRGRTFTAKLGDPGSHAELALYGSFRDGKREGVFVLWRYRSR